MKLKVRDEIEKKTNLQKIKKKIDKNQNNKDQIWNKNSMKSNDRDEIGNKSNLQKICKKKIDENPIDLIFFLSFFNWYFFQFHHSIFDWLGITHHHLSWFAFYKVILVLWLGSHVFQVNLDRLSLFYYVTFLFFFSNFIIQQWVF